MRRAAYLALLFALVLLLMDSAKPKPAHSDAGRERGGSNVDRVVIAVRG